ELTGRNGYREVVGLEEQNGQGRPALYHPPVDGQDVELTLDLELQRWAEKVINRPKAAPEGDEKPDDAWTENPVGAIVLMKVTGEVLAAASAPLVPGKQVGGADGQALLILERTMRQPTFLPPGSILKPLVAAYALENLGLNPEEARVACSWVTEHKSKKFAGWGKVDCHRRYGHTETNFAKIGGKDITLARALLVSCNTYFANMGDRLYDEDDFRELFRVFGLGQPSGVRFLSGVDSVRRGGLREEWGLEEKRSYSVVDRQRLANGLSEMSTTPLAMATAYAGLATGQLPEARLVQSVGGRVVPTQSIPIKISERHLSTVRHALRAVVSKSGGSAHGVGLDEASLGFTFACKTGSADYRKGLIPPYTDNYVRGDQQDLVHGMRKHTWIAGWFPADNPRYVALFYLHDTATTSGHGAVHLAAQFLSNPLLDQLLEED
ncbi:MAG: cell division protein FtsI/penicillin-binding protein 2, partial [Planctomycetota bacterium]